ncbi:MAG: tetratricopeptide repeat protein [Candidatus Zixiibacteriota bacterium]
MLAKEPAERYSDFGEVCAALEALRGNLDADDEGGSLRVTVFPVRARSADSDDALFAEGLTEELVMGLGKLEAVDVTPLAQVKKLTETELTPELSREKFGADILVGGAIRRAGDKIRITVALTETSSGKVIWDDKYDSTVNDLFELQDTVTAEIVSALGEHLAPDATAAKASRGTENVEAYEFYLKGRKYLTRNTQDDMEYARKMLERAIEIDQNYPLAYAGLADLHGSLFMNYYDRSHENWERGIEMAKKAIELGPTMPIGYRAQGRLLHLQQHYDEAIEALKRAAAIDASYGETYRTLAWACEGKGSLSESLAWTRKALSINPHDEETILLQGILNYDLNNMAQAINAFQRCLELAPDYGRAHYFLAKSYQKMGQFEQALKKYVVADRFGGQSEITWDYGWLHLCLGNTDEAISLLGRASESKEQEFSVRYYLAIAQRVKGDLASAQKNFRRTYEVCRRQIEEGDPTMHPALVMCLCETGLGIGDRGESRFRELAEKVTTNGELAILCAQYSSERGWREETVKWLDRALNWRLGFAEPEALIEPFFKDYQDEIKELGHRAQAA